MIKSYMKAEYAALGVSASGLVLSAVGAWGLLATVGVAWTGVFGTITACGLTTVLLGLVLISRDLVDETTLGSDGEIPPHADHPPSAD